MSKTIICEARDPSQAFMTLTLEGSTSDRRRLMNVLLHLLDDDGEWDSPRPNVRFVVNEPTA